MTVLLLLFAFFVLKFTVDPSFSGEALQDEMVWGRSPMAKVMGRES
jgi:hypothetical protein